MLLLIFDVFVLKSGSYVILVTTLSGNLSIAEQASFPVAIGTCFDLFFLVTVEIIAGSVAGGVLVCILLVALLIMCWCVYCKRK